jgi:hypothetical protein
MERKFELLPGVVQVLLTNGQAPEDVVPVLLEAAELARARRKDLLVVSGLDDPATAEAISAAIQKMHDLGTSPSRIAFVAYALPQYSVYHFAQDYAERCGIVAKVLVSLNDARDWLGSREERAARGSPATAA